MNTMNTWTNFQQPHTQTAPKTRTHTQTAYKSEPYNTSKHKSEPEQEKEE